MVLIAVHGTASRLLAAERGTVPLLIELEDDDRAAVVRRAADLHARFAAAAQTAVEAGAATRWAGGQVAVRAEQRYEAQDRVRLVQVATAEVTVRFRDLGALAAWVQDAGEEPGVSIDRIDWAVTEEHRARVERELRVLAVQDAVARAEAYASAVGGGPVALVQLWEAGLRPSTGVTEPGPTVAVMARKAASPGFDLRPEDIAIEAAVTADFEVDAAR